MNQIQRDLIDEAAPSARLTVSACLVTLGALLTQLPGPAEAWATLTGDQPLRSTGDPLAAVQTILLTTAGLLAWLIAGWAVVVLVVGALTRMPGRPGHRARRLLPRIAPATAGRLVLATVGASLIAGTAACAAPVAAPAGASDPSSGPAAGQSVDPSGGAAAPDGSFTIDWPDPAPGAGPSSESEPGLTGSAPSSPGPTPVPPPTAIATGSPAPVPTTGSASDATASPTTPAGLTFPAPPGPTNATTGPAPAASSPSSGSAAQDPPPASVTAAAGPTPQPIAAPPAAPIAPPDLSDSPEPSVRIVTVQPGDSLWRIAAHSLGPDATDADIDNAWRAWYFGNRQVIGDDPDRIVPGQFLVAPGEQVRQ
ncbi:LysM peptidoglycan-binding domain-containing protein [Nakamurella sp.]|uniref:LysM peptidoglycan-binding domain-containing protein n=1 Tax=Nakamurella sp. TaxID=1869182 RepID=UPI003B3AAA57